MTPITRLNIGWNPGILNPKWNTKAIRLVSWLKPSQMTTHGCSTVYCPGVDGVVTTPVSDTVT